MNSFGRILRLTTFGESHGKAIGGVLDGLPAGIQLDLQEIQRKVNLRRPGSSQIVSPRVEKDHISYLSGILADSTTNGAPIGFVIENTNVQSEDYQSQSHLFRPAHADYTYFQKYGISPQPGGGRASARETACRCVGGAIAEEWLKTKGIKIYPYLHSLGSITLGETALPSDYRRAYNYLSRCPDKSLNERIVDEITKLREKGDSIGGIVGCVVEGVCPGVGEPLYDKLSARLAYAMMGINAAKGFEIGSGFAISKMNGSEANDPITTDENGKVIFKSNHSGGIVGGISTGQDILFRVAFKPTPTIGITQETISINNEKDNIRAKGRHDPALVVRAVAVVGAMAALTVADLMLLQQGVSQSSRT